MISRGFCLYFGEALYKTKTLVKFVDSRKSSRSPFQLRSGIMFLLLPRNFKAILRGSSFSTFGGVSYKTKILVKFVDSRKSCRSPFQLRSGIMFDRF